MYQKILFIFCLLFRAENIQHNGVLAHIEIKSDELIDISNLSISIKDLEDNTISFDNVKKEYSNKGEFKFTLGIIDSHEVSNIFGSKESCYLVELYFEKSEEFITKHILVERRKKTNFFKICSVEKHTSTLIKKFVDLIMVIEEKKLPFEKMLEELMKEYTKEQYTYKLLEFMKTNYEMKQDEIAELSSIDESNMSENIQVDNSIRAKQLFDYLNECDKAIRELYWQENQGNGLCFNYLYFNILYAHKSSYLIYNILNDVYNLLARKAFENSKINYFDLLKVDFSLEFERCVVLKTHLKIDCSNYTDEIINRVQTMSNKGNINSRNENNKSGVIIKSIEGINYNCMNFRRTLNPFCFDGDFYFSFEKLVSKNVRVCQIVYNYENEKENRVFEHELSWWKIHCIVGIE